MKIALMMENSQAPKNAIILKELNAVAEEKGFPVYNVGMSDENDHHLTYIHLGIMASILLNSKAVDFVVTGCGTGQGALMSLNIHPGVVCGEPRMSQAHSWQARRGARSRPAGVADPVGGTERKRQLLP